MNGRGTAGRLIASLAVMALVGGCTSGTSATPVPNAPTPTNLPSVAAATPAATPAPTPIATPGVVVTTGVGYESTNPELTPDALDVYAPATAGPWPVVVMFAAGPRSNQSAEARRVAELGFVVFNASWGNGPGMAADPPTYDSLLATMSQAACAVAYARAHAAEYGGDPGTMTLFGQSAGAHPAAMVTFARPAPTPGCLGGGTLGPIDALVTWEGNWLLSINAPDWDAALATDPRVMDAVTPWTYLAMHTDQRVVMLVSADPNASIRSEFPGFVSERPVGDPWAADSWLAVRDPSGDLRRQLEANGALADGTIGFTDSQQLLYALLRAQGNPVTLDVMPDSSHAWLRGAGWDVFLAAFPKAAQRD